MALNLQQLFASVTVYGAPLYGTTPAIDHGQIEFAGQYPVVDNCLVIEEDAGIVYIPIRRSTLEAPGFDPSTHMFRIGGFEALRDASGEFNGKAWSVAKGDVKTFAF
jgi:hypothetical protein